MDHDSTFPVIIERRLTMRESANAAPANIVIEIGQPYWIIAGREAACPVAIRGTVGRVEDIRGIDPMSSMQQAISFVEIYLEHRASKAKFFWPNGEPY